MDGWVQRLSIFLYFYISLFLYFHISVFLSLCLSVFLYCCVSAFLYSSVLSSARITYRKTEDGRHNLIKSAGGQAIHRFSIFSYFCILVLSYVRIFIFSYFCPHPTSFIFLYFYIPTSIFLYFCLSVFP